jgi:hypothetical protein
MAAPAPPQQRSDTAHLYDGKVVRSSAPSRKKAAGQMQSGSDVPEDAIPDVHIPGFIEALLGGPIVPKHKFLPADKMVQTLQLGAYAMLVALGLITWIVTPPQGTIWYLTFGSIGFATLLHSAIILSATGTGLWGTMSRDPRWLLASYSLFILSAMRFASSKVTLSSDWFDLATYPWLATVLVVVYAVLLVMYFELTNGVIRFSMLDTSIRTNEVYVMNVKRIISKYHRSLLINPVIAGSLAAAVLSINTIIPAVVRLFSSETAVRMEESVELISVYGVALGSLFVFLLVGLMFAINLPHRLQKWRESRD